MTTQPEETANFTDIDAYLSSVAGERKTVRIAGRDWELAPSLPTIIPLRLARYAAEGQLLNDEDRVAFASALLGPDNIEELLILGVSADALDALLISALAMYRGQSGGNTLEALARSITDTTEQDDSDSGDEPDPKG